MRELRVHEQLPPQQQQQQQQQQGEGPLQRRLSLSVLSSLLPFSRSHNSGAAAAAAAAAGGSSGAAAGSSGGCQGGSSGRGSFAWHCCNPKCGQEEEEPEAEADTQQDEQQLSDQQQQQSEQQQQQPKARASGGQCWCRADRPQLELQVVLPGDLFPKGQTEAASLKRVVAQLQQVAQVGLLG
jgi:hypothetical protein